MRYLFGVGQAGLGRDLGFLLSKPSPYLKWAEIIYRPGPNTQIQGHTPALEQPTLNGT